MTQTTPTIDRYLAQFQALEASRSPNGTRWLHALRKAALGQFAALGFPIARRGNEAWKYTSVAPIAREAFEYGFALDVGKVSAAAVRSLAPRDAGWVRLVFVNGQFVRALSTALVTDGARVTSLAEAASTDRDLVEPHLAHYAQFERDGFTALNTAFLWDGAFVWLRADHQLEQPVHIVHVAAGRGAPTSDHPRALAVVGPRSKATIVETYVSVARAPHFTNAVTEIVLEDGASVDYYRLLMEGASAFHVGTTQVRQAKDSTFFSLAAARGGALARHNLNVLLDAPGSRCDLNGLYLTTGAEHVDNSTLIDHARPNTTSREYYKGILDGRSHAVFTGKVIVRREAPKADAHQTNRNLLLSEGAEIDTKPTLEIFADDVRCTHGATAGQLDRTTMFYLMSRGLDEEAARRMLVRAFAGEIIERAHLTSIRSYLDRLFGGTPRSFGAGGQS